MKIIVDEVVLENNRECWVVKYREVYDQAEQKAGEPPEKLIQTVLPTSTLTWRMAEYGFGLEDQDLLIDLIVLEPYIPREFYDGPTGLFNAPTIEDARVAYRAEIIRLKLLYRVSTKTKNHPLVKVRELSAFHPGDVAIKGMGVILERHRRGVQKQDPHVVRTLGLMERALSEGKNDNG